MSTAAQFSGLQLGVVRHPDRVRLPDLLTTSVLPASELSALRLDGELYPVGPAWSPVDLPEDREARAAALGTLFAGRLVSDRLSAAWVHGAADRLPTPIPCCVPSTDRGAAGLVRGLDIRELRLADGDVVEIAGLRLTSPSRTAVDLLRAEGYTAVHRDAVARLAASDAAREAIAVLLGQRRFAAGAERARHRLRLSGAGGGSAGQPAETR